MVDKRKFLIDVYDELCSYKNLELAFKRARIGKTTKQYVITFEEDLDENLWKLRNELLFQSYHPRPLKTFILRDPKTRKISKSDFRDRIVHHAICNIISPKLEKEFIYDTYANRIRKGTSKAHERFDSFKYKVSKNNTKPCYILKADIKHYFEDVDHEVLFSILKRRIKDKRLLWLIEVVLSNYNTSRKGKGMPLGNLTSQFFANVYLNELDQFAKKELRAKYYIRYVDDFVIFSGSKELLEQYKKKISQFTKDKLKLEIHPGKSKILNLNKGICFLGLRIFYYHKLIRKKNLRKSEKKFVKMRNLYKLGLIEREKVVEKFEGWLAYISNANTFKYRRHLIRTFNDYFPLEPILKVTSVTKHENFQEKVKSNSLLFSQQKTLKLLKEGLNQKEISEKRSVKESTVWLHIANLIEHHQYSVRKVLPKEKVNLIFSKIHNENDKLSNIKKRINDDSITYDEINCVLANVKCQHKEKSIAYLAKWYQKTNCYRKCYFNKGQRKECKMKFDYFASQSPTFKMKKKDFLDFFNDNMNICVLPEKEKRNFMSWGHFKTNILSIKKKEKIMEE